MFTGLVEDVGTVERASRTAAGLEVRVRSRYDDLVDGESIAVNGACLTVRERGKGFFTCAAVEATLAVTTIGAWQVGTRVNLERALRVGDRLGGHFVQGHVDGVARVMSAELIDDAKVIELALPSGLSELTVERGSIAVDGVSLTVHALPAPDLLQVFIIEYTRRHTTLGELQAGASVHIEVDMLAKHVRRLLQSRTSEV